MTDIIAELKALRLYGMASSMAMPTCLENGGTAATIWRRRTG